MAVIEHGAGSGWRTKAATCGSLRGRADPAKVLVL